MLEPPPKLSLTALARGSDGDSASMVMTLSGEKSLPSVSGSKLRPTWPSRAHTNSPSELRAMLKRSAGKSRRR